MNSRRIEIKVGIFVILGFVFTALLILAFGRLNGVFESKYQVIVQFEDASGILKNSEVSYRGAKVGKVAQAPEMTENSDHVSIILSINNEVKIPDNASFKIETRGLLGDRFVKVIAPPETPLGYIKDGDVVVGKSSAGINEIAENAKPVLERINTIIARLETEVITDEVAADFKATLANSKSVSARVDQLLAEAQEGKGAIHLLMKDPQVASEIKQAVDDFKKLAYNLRVKGILSYKDLSEEPEKEDVPKNRSSRSR